MGTVPGAPDESSTANVRLIGLIRAEILARFCYCYRHRTRL